MPKTKSLLDLRVIPLPDFNGLERAEYIPANLGLVPQYSSAIRAYELYAQELHTHIQVLMQLYNATDTVTVQGQVVRKYRGGGWLSHRSALLDIPDSNTLTIDIDITDDSGDEISEGTYTIAVTREFEVLKGVTISFNDVIDDLRAKRKTRISDVQTGVAGLGADEVSSAWGSNDYGEDRIFMPTVDKQAPFQNIDELNAAYDSGIRRIRKYYPTAPPSVANAAIIRFVGYLADAPHYNSTSDAGAFTRCGADALLKPYKNLRAVSAK